MAAWIRGRQRRDAFAREMLSPDGRDSWSEDLADPSDAEMEKSTITLYYHRNGADKSWEGGGGGNNKRELDAFP